LILEDVTALPRNVDGLLRSDWSTYTRSTKSSADLLQKLLGFIKTRFCSWPICVIFTPFFKSLIDTVLRTVLSVCIGNRYRVFSVLIYTALRTVLTVSIGNIYRVFLCWFTEYYVQCLQFVLVTDAGCFLCCFTQHYVQCLQFVLATDTGCFLNGAAANRTSALPICGRDSPCSRAQTFPEKSDFTYVRSYVIYGQTDRQYCSRAYSIKQTNIFFTV
jgi:hypothetical protein